MSQELKQLPSKRMISENYLRWKSYQQSATGAILTSCPSRSRWTGGHHQVSPGVTRHHQVSHRLNLVGHSSWKCQVIPRLSDWSRLNKLITDGAFQCKDGKQLARQKRDCYGSFQVFASCSCGRWSRQVRTNQRTIK